MNHTRVTGLFLLGILSIAILLSSCAHRNHATLPQVSKMPTPSHNTLVQEAKAETAQLRSALASERIKSAKQTATLRMAQDLASSLQKREEEHMTLIAKLRSEVETIKAERDRLKSENAGLHAQTSSLPELLKMVTQIRTMETSLTGMTSSLQSLSGEISHMKQEIKEQDITPTRTVKKAPSPSRLLTKKIDLSKTELITVQRGDSLWRLSRQFGISIKGLKKLNQLTGDQIVVGQQLLVPSHGSPTNEEMVEIPSPPKSPNP